MIAFYGEDSAAKAKLVESIKECCLYNGFFQIIGHRVPIKLQKAVMRCTQRFFELPLERKLEFDKSTTSSRSLRISCTNFSGQKHV